MSRSLPSRAPLSFHQRSIWFSERMHSDVAFNLPFACRLTGPLREESLRRCVELVVHRHEVLRSRFEVDRGTVFQCVLPPDAVDVISVDLTSLDPDQGEKRCDELAREEARRPFDLERGPLVRARLFRLGERHHFLLVTVHHLAFDGWSVGILLSELAAAYDAISRGRDPHLPELPIQYADYARWQACWPETPRAAAQLDWWKEHMAGRPTRMDLPTCRPRPEVRTYHGAQATVEYGADFRDPLAECARREAATLFQALLAGFAVLLSREGCGEEIVVGTPFFARSRPETGPLIGAFVNLLLLRTDLSRDPSFREILRRVRDMAMGAFANAELPLEVLMRALSPDRSPSEALGEELHRAPVPVQFQLMSLPDGAYEREANGLEFRLVDLDTETIWSELEFSFLEAGGGLHLTVHYNTDLFEPDRVLRMTRDLGHILESASKNPDQPISRVGVR